MPLYLHCEITLVQAYKVLRQHKTQKYARNIQATVHT